NDGAPCRGHFPEILRTRVSIVGAHAASASKNGKCLIGLKKLIGSNAIAGDQLEILLPPFGHFVASHEPFSQSILEHMIFRHQFTERAGIAGVNAFDEFHDDVESFGVAHRASPSGRSPIISTSGGERGRVLDLCWCGCETDSIRTYNMADTQKQIVTVGVTGASGAVLAQKTLSLLEQD